MNKPKLTAVLSIKDEENRILRRHMENLAEFCDEIVVTVDRSTTDNSFNICREFTEKVYYIDEKKFDTEYKEPLFEGLKYSEGEWFLLDEADFIYSDQLKMLIKDAISSDNNIVAYQIPFCNNYFGKWFTNNEDLTWHYRLFKKDNISFITSSLHIREYNFNGETGIINSIAFHWGNWTIEELLQRINKYTTHDAYILLKTRTGGLYNRKGDSFNLNKYWKEASKYFKKSYIKHGHYKGGKMNFILDFMKTYINIFLENAKIYELEYKDKLNYDVFSNENLSRIAEEINTKLKIKRKRKLIDKILAKSVGKWIQYYIDLIRDRYDFKKNTLYN